MKSLWTGLALLLGILSTMAQKESFEERLKLDVLDESTIQRWDFGATTSISCLSDGLWEHLLPKSTLGTDKIILNRNELNYFLEVDAIKIKTETDPFANPGHWENRFGKQIQTITLNKPLAVLAIKNGKLTRFSLDSLVGIQYATFYPYGGLDVADYNEVPIVYQQENQFDEHSPVLLVTSSFLERVDLETAQIQKDTVDTVLYDTENFSVKQYITGVDFNNDGQDEVVMYYETTQDRWASEGDEGGSNVSLLIAFYFKDHWYRTSYWEDGQDGIEGF